jgi:hypothetical protein
MLHGVLVAWTIALSRDALVFKLEVNPQNLSCASLQRRLPWILLDAPLILPDPDALQIHLHFIQHDSQRCESFLSYAEFAISRDCELLYRLSYHKLCLTAMGNGHGAHH